MKKIINRMKNNIMNNHELRYYTFIYVIRISYKTIRYKRYNKNLNK